MDGEVSFEALRRVQLAEKNSPSLTPLEQDFFKSYSRHLGELRARLQQGFSLEAARAYESELKVLQDISRRRQQKIMLKSLHDFQTGGVGSEGLALEEKELYTSLITLISRYQPGLEVQAEPVKQDEGPGNLAPNSPVRVKLLVDIPQFVGSSGPIGPFAAGAWAQLSRDDAQLLVSQGAAQTI